MAERSQTQVWIKQARQGDHLAVSKLLACYHPVLRGRLDARMDRVLKAKLEPEDLLQEVYLEVFRRMAGDYPLAGRFEDRGPDAFLNWVLTILDHKLIDTWRTLHRKVRDVAREMPSPPTGGTASYWNLLDQVYADPGTPSRVVRREEAVGALLACIPRLSDLHRQVIQLRFLEGLSLGEVAGRLDKPQTVIVSLTRRALEALRKSMDRLGEFTHGG